VSRVPLCRVQRLGLPALLALTAVMLTACSGSGAKAGPPSSASSSPDPAASGQASTPGAATLDTAHQLYGAHGRRSTLPGHRYLGPPTTQPTQPTPGIPTTSAGCSASGLALVGTGGQGAAGTLISTFGLRNTGTGTCVLSGFPSASLVDAQGRQVGAAARRQGAAGGQVRLATGQAASFQLAVAHAGCPSSAPVSHGLRVYPPGDRGSLLVPYSQPVCTTPTVTAVVASG